MRTALKHAFAALPLLFLVTLLFGCGGDGSTTTTPPPPAGPTISIPAFTTRTGTAPTVNSDSSITFGSTSGTIEFTTGLAASATSMTIRGTYDSTGASTAALLYTDFSLEAYRVTITLQAGGTLQISADDSLGFGGTCPGTPLSIGSGIAAGDSFEYIIQVDNSTGTLDLLVGVGTTPAPAIAGCTLATSSSTGIGISANDSTYTYIAY